MIFGLLTELTRKRMNDPLRFKVDIFFNVHIFWEGNKFLQHLHRREDKSTVEMLQNIVAFSEYMNFNYVATLNENKV